MLPGMTWTCHVCGRERPDASISVWKHHRLIGTVPFEENVRYCNDNEPCLEGAMNKHFVPASEGESQ